MKMKRFLSIVLSLVLVFALSACGKDNQDSKNQETETATSTDTSTDTTDTTPDTSSADYTLIKDGTLSVGVEIGYPPFEDFAEDGVTPIGYDIDFANALAEKMGVEVNFINTAWDGIFKGIGTNYDVVISAVTIDPERKKSMDFSDPYIDSYQAIVVPKDSKITISSLNDLNGKSVALQKETTSDVLITDMIDTGTIDATVVANEKVITCFTQLTNGEVDVVLCDSTVADGYVASNPDKYVKIFEDNTSPEQFGVAIEKGNTGLQAAINAAIAELKEEGFFDSNIEKWFGAGE
ncbi:transporter substrate-binding domain-containing protein [Anaerosporobacter sp.]